MICFEHFREDIWVLVNIQCVIEVVLKRHYTFMAKSQTWTKISTSPSCDSIHGKTLSSNRIQQQWRWGLSQVRHENFIIVFPFCLCKQVNTFLQCSDDDEMLRWDFHVVEVLGLVFFLYILFIEKLCSFQEEQKNKQEIGISGKLCELSSKATFNPKWLTI